MDTTNRHVLPFTIVIGVDYSELGEQAIDHGIRAARSHEHATLHLIHVIGASADGVHVGKVVEPDLTRESARLYEHVQRSLAPHLEGLSDGVAPPFERLMTHIGLYNAAESIAQLAADVEADLVVVGTHGRRGVQRLLLGSVAEATVRLAPCPVLVVRPRGVSATPTIAPPCPRCLETRASTSGRDFWCDQHSQVHARPHTYSIGGQRSSHQSGLLVPF